MDDEGPASDEGEAGGLAATHPTRLHRDGGDVIHSQSTGHGRLSGVRSTAGGRGDLVSGVGPGISPRGAAVSEVVRNANRRARVQSV